MLMRFDPFRELDRLSEDTLSRTRSSAMPLDAYRQGDRFIIAVDLPGVDPSSIDVTVEKNVLTLRAERAWPRQNDQEWAVAERRQGTFTRQLFLGDTLDTDSIGARYEQGVLTLEIPVAERAKPRKVDISTGETATHSIDANSREREAVTA